MKTLKKLDFIIIISLLILSFIPNIIFYINNSKNYESTYAVVKISGEIYDKIDLSKNTDAKELLINTKYGSNTISISDNKIEIKNADCHDKLCVKQGSVSKVGQSVICLPHELIIEIKGDVSDSDSDMLLSH